MAEKNSDVARAKAEAELVVIQAKLEVAKLEVAEAEAKLLLAKSEEGSLEAKEAFKITELEKPYVRLGKKEARNFIARQEAIENAAKEYTLVCKNSTYPFKHLTTDLDEIINLRDQKVFIENDTYTYHARKVFFNFIKLVNLNKDENVLQQVETCLKRRIYDEQNEQEKTRKRTPEEIEYENMMHKLYY
jgi:hypothetical protein